MPIIELHGMGLTRKVYWGGNPLDPKESLRFHNDDFSPNTGFNWGCAGSGSVHLALALMIRYRKQFKTDMCDDTVKKLHILLKDQIVQNLPQGSFHVRLRISEWVADNYQDKGVKPPQYYMDINIGGKEKIWIKKFIDFPYLGFDLGIFQKNTIEYEKIAKLRVQDSDNAYFVQYLKERSRRFSPSRKKDIEIEIIYDKPQDIYFVKNGMGSGNYYGHYKKGARKEYQKVDITNQ